MGAGAAGAFRPFENQARTTPKLPSAVINTIAARTSDVDPSTDATGCAGSRSGTSSAGNMLRGCFRTRHDVGSIGAYCTAASALPYVERQSLRDVVSIRPADSIVRPR